MKDWLTVIQVLLFNAAVILPLDAIGNYDRPIVQEFAIAAVCGIAGWLIMKARERM